VRLPHPSVRSCPTVRRVTAQHLRDRAQERRPTRCICGVDRDPEPHVGPNLARLIGYSYYVITDQWLHDDAPTYVNYIRLMHALAKDIDVSADALEFYLFEPGKRFAEMCDTDYWMP
jgi:hypothetical protein